MRWGIGANNKLSAEERRQLAKARLEKIKSDADEAKELAELEASAYQAEVDAQSAKVRAKQLRKQAGHLTVGERLTGAFQGVGGGDGFSRVARGVGDALAAAGRGLLTPDDAPRRRRPTTKAAKSTKRKRKV